MSSSKNSTGMAWKKRGSVVLAVRTLTSLIVPQDVLPQAVPVLELVVVGVAVRGS